MDDKAFWKIMQEKFPDENKKRFIRLPKIENTRTYYVKFKKNEDKPNEKFWNELSAIFKKYPSRHFRCVLKIWKHFRHEIRITRPKDIL